MPVRCPLQLHAASTIVVGDNPFGRVAAGEVTLSSWTMTVCLSEANFEAGYLVGVGDAPKAYRIHPDLKYFRDGMAYFDADPFSLPQAQVVLLQLISSGTTIHGSGAWAVGLVLIRI